MKFIVMISITELYARCCQMHAHDQQGNLIRLGFGKPKRVSSARQMRMVVVAFLLIRHGFRARRNGDSAWRVLFWAGRDNKGVQYNTYTYNTHAFAVRRGHETKQTLARQLNGQWRGRDR